MESESLKQVVNVLSKLIHDYNEMAVQIVAAERVFQRESPALFDAYIREKASVWHDLNPPAPLEVLQGLLGK